MKLVTIPVSHFCEKARWGLDRSGLACTGRRFLAGDRFTAANLTFAALVGAVVSAPAGQFALLTYQDWR